MVSLRHAAALCLVLLGGVLASGAHASGVEWKPFDQGLQDASSKRKYSFVSVYTDWCGYCRKLDRETLRAEPVVAELKKHFVSVKLNAESDEKVTWKGKTMSKRDLALLWGVEGYPTMLFLDSKGEIIGKFPSYAEADLMIRLLTYISSGARERNVSFEDFLKKEPS
jgi:thioredoxin-related protein